MKNKMLLFMTGLMCLQVSFAQQTKDKFTEDIEYLTYKPADYASDTIKKWPLVIFLHGAGERGTDIEKIKVHGPPMHVENGKDFPFILISPQAKSGWQPDFLYKMIVDFTKNNRVDKDRIYLTGLSMGGYGTWSLSQKYPNLFAAIAPICGGGTTKDLWKLRNMPVWCFHGEKDEIVRVSQSQKMVDELRKYNDSVKFTIYPDVYHDSWIKTYEDPAFYEWLLDQRKFEYKEITVEKIVLDDYIGSYDFNLKGQEGVLKIVVEENKLMADFKTRKTPLKAFSKDSFFIQKKMSVEFQFLRDESGEVIELMLITNERNTFKKITTSENIE